MCQHYIAKYGRNCLKAGNPYCHLHKPKGESTPTVKTEPCKSAVGKSIECLICCERSDQYTTTACCGHQICNLCIVRSGTHICPYCRADEKKGYTIPEGLKILVDYVGDKDKQIKAAKNDYIAAYRQAREYERKVIELRTLLAALQVSE